MSEEKVDLTKLSPIELLRYTAVAVVEAEQCASVCQKAVLDCPDLCEDIKEELLTVYKHSVEKYKTINESYEYLIGLLNGTEERTDKED